MLALMKKRVDTLAERTEMLEAAADPSRLTARGKYNPGQLLREEKLRNKIEKGLPKWNKELRDMAAEWCAAHPGDDLTYEGRAIGEIVDEQEKAFAKEKDDEKRRKEEEKRRKEEEKKPAQITTRSSTAAAPPKKSVGGPAAAAPTRNVVKAPPVPKAEPAPPKAEASKLPTAPSAKPPPPPPVEGAPPASPQHAQPSERVLRALDMAPNSPTPPAPAKAVTAAARAPDPAVALD